jgi:hypothetical protein
VPAAAPVVVIVGAVAVAAIAAIAVIPTATAILPAGTTVVAVASVRVATPDRVPEFTGTPLRERTRLCLGYAGDS